MHFSIISGQTLLYPDKKEKEKEKKKKKKKSIKWVFFLIFRVISSILAISLMYSSLSQSSPVYARRFV